LSQQVVNNAAQLTAQAQNTLAQVQIWASPSFITATTAPPVVNLFPALNSSIYIPPSPTYVPTHTYVPPQSLVSANGGISPSYIHAALAAGSFAPSGIGAASSAVDGLLYLGEGDWTNAGVSLVAAGIGVVSDAGAARLALKGGQVGLDALNVGRAAESVPALTSGQLGRAGEAAVRGAYDIGDKLSIEINGRVRIPDGLKLDTVSEVKNTGSLSFTQQLRDYSDFAQQNRMNFDLYTRPTTQLSGPLQDAISSGQINRLDIPQ
jgi:hypothetical protein